MARKRRRRKLKAGPVLWLLAVANIAVGLFFSPVTAATHVTVTGAKESDMARIESELQWLADRPCLNLNGESVAEQILRRPDMRSAELTRNIFGRAELSVDYYRPVAQVHGSRGRVLTDGGFLCAVPDASNSLPEIYLYPQTQYPSFGASTSWEPEKVADVCDRAFKQGIVKNLSITVTVRGSVCLNSGVTGRVVLGAPDELDAKFEQIRRILAAQPALLAEGKELVLIAPNKPVTRQLQGNAL